MRGTKAKAIRKFWRSELVKRPEVIDKVLTLPNGQRVVPERLAYQRLKGRRMIPV